MKKVLILSANPINTTQLRLNTEVREIQLALERKRNRDEFELIPRLAVRIDDLQRKAEVRRQKAEGLKY